MPQTIARNQQCLMIEADDRRYFTSEEYMPQLLEFCKSFDMHMSIVNVEQAPILDIKDLPKAVCDAKKTPKAQFSLVRKVLPFDPSICVPLVRTRSHILETAKAVRMKIRDRFSKGEAVSLDMLKEEFPDASISPATFMQHVRIARKELKEKGYLFERISPGCYRSISPEQQKVAEMEKKAIWKKYPPIPVAKHNVFWGPVEFAAKTAKPQLEEQTVAHLPGTVAEKTTTVTMKPVAVPLTKLAQPDNPDHLPDNLANLWHENIIAIINHLHDPTLN